MHVFFVLNKYVNKEKYNFDIPVAQIYFGQHHCTMGYSLSEKVKKKRKYSCSFIDWLYVLMDKS